MPDTLSPEQIAHFHKTGDLALPARVPEARLTEIRAEVARFEAIARTMTAADDRPDPEDSHRPDETACAGSSCPAPGRRRSTPYRVPR